MGPAGLWAPSIIVTFLPYVTALGVGKEPIENTPRYWSSAIRLLLSGG